MSNEKVFCKDCKFCKSGFNGVLYCLVLPPVVHFVRDLSVSVYPTVREMDYCSIGCCIEEMPGGTTIHDPDSRALLFNPDSPFGLPSKSELLQRHFPEESSRIVRSLCRIQSLVESPAIQNIERKDLEEMADLLEDIAIDLESDVS